ncbi:MAG: adenosylcobalamin-dependent ribonucleoside-diphosphate reductase [Chloroflexota bacterium]|nr:adenosylcobalamin-dependent ribonucleoside-diphosphate reductase [Chloroflexota bacterium]
MVDIRSRTDVERDTALADLRDKLAATTEPAVRAALQAAIDRLQSDRLQAGAPAVTPAGPSRGHMARALEATGMTRPEDGDGPHLTENAQRVLAHRYYMKNDQFQPVEDARGMFLRVARAIAEADRNYGATDLELAETTDTFYGMMTRLEFLPNSPTMMNAGTNAGTLSACFVLPLEDSMSDIMKTASDIAMVQKFGGGTGVPLSNLRQKGAHISSTHGKACGPIAVLRHLSSVSTMITQGGKRDGANMAVMSVHHPDIEEFIDCKAQEGEIHNFNISVGATDAFMRAVVDGGAIAEIDPVSQEPTGVERNARDLFTKIVEGAWRNGEPGMIFLDEVNRRQPTPHLGSMEATNPCGEQPLLPYESCNLGSINLTKMLTFGPDGAEIDWDLLRSTVRTAAHFLDNTIDANNYSVPEIERMNLLTRKTGLGVMGFADMLVRLGVSYDSEEGVEIGRAVMRFIADEARAESERLAELRGPFLAWEGSRQQLAGMKPQRNACQLTVAPTGTISMIAGCSSGIEPIFALAFRKHNILEGQTLYYIDSAFEAVARHEGFYSDELAEYLSTGSSLQDSEETPEWVKDVFTTAPDISPEWHVRMQAAFQESTDAAISKTINLPNSATIDDVEHTYMQAWETGCKGITVYRAGSREKEVLTAGTSDTSTAIAEVSEQEEGHRTMRSRPPRVSGVTERVRTSHGNMYITINFDGEGRPFEVFTALGKAGSSDQAQLEGISRLVSMALRSGVDPASIVAQLRGITDEPVWSEGTLVRSAPDALALALARVCGMEPGSPYGAQFALFSKESASGGVALPLAPSAPDVTPHLSHWGRCPECSGPLVYEEGCQKCYECGYNKCG